MQETERLGHYKILILTFTFLFFTSAFSQNYPGRKIDSLLKSGIHNIINQNYSNAKNEFKVLKKSYPRLPFGDIYLAAVQIAKAYDYGEQYDSDLIESHLEAAKETSEYLLSLNEDNLWYTYFYALTEGYVAYFDALNGNWLSALSTGVNSISAFEKCLDLDDKFFEAYIAIGTFEYWQSRKMEFLNGLPFYEDRTKVGIENLRTACDSASYNSYLAINSLIWIYIDQKDFKKAAELGEKTLHEFPGSRYFKWGLARAYEEINPLKSINLYQEILESFQNKNRRNYINEITLKHLIAQQYLKIGKREKALALCEEILGIENLTEFEHSKLDERIQRVKELQESLSK